MDKGEKPYTGPIDDRAEAYKKSGDMVAALAKAHTNIDVDETTHERWRQVMGLMREVDTWADDTDVSQEEVLLGLADFEMFSSRYPDLTPEALGHETHEKMVARTGRILKLGQRATEATSLSRYIAFRALEARETVNLIGDSATEYVTSQPDFEAKFLPLVRRLGEAATLWDSLVDGFRDVKMGKQTVKPNIKYYTDVTRAMIGRTKGIKTALFHVGPNVQLLAKLEKRITTRLKNGIPEYSTLRMFSRKPSKNEI